MLSQFPGLSFVWMLRCDLDPSIHKSTSSLKESMEAALRTQLHDGVAKGLKALR